jgi:hypothetical protein
MRDLSELTTKMRLNLLKLRAEKICEPGTILHVGAAEHLIIRGLIRKVESAERLGRAKGIYHLTAAGVTAASKL